MKYYHTFIINNKSRMNFLLNDQLLKTEKNYPFLEKEK